MCYNKTYRVHFTFLLFYIAEEYKMCLTSTYIFHQGLSSKKTPEHVTLNKSCNPQIKQIKVQTMNGRIYDPTIGQFLSPDNYVQLPDASLGFNRYSYCLNNPLVYTDPSGEFVWMPVIIGAAIGATSGAFMAHQAGAEGFLEWAGYIGAGALIGGLSGGAASGVSALGAAPSIAGAAAGAVGGAGFTGLSTGGLDVTQWDMGLVGRGALIGAASGLVGGAIGSAIGGPGGAFAGGFASDVTNQILSPGDVDLLRSLAAGGLSYGMYHGIQFGQYKWGGGNKVGDIDISYKQFSKINAMYQRSQSILGSRKEGGVVLNIGGKGKDWGYFVDPADRYYDHVDFNNPKGNQILVHSHVRNQVTRAFPSHSTGGPKSDVSTMRGYHSLVVSPTGSSTMMGYQTNPNVLIQSSPYVRFSLFPWLW